MHSTKRQVSQHSYEGLSWSGYLKWEDAPETQTSPSGGRLDKRTWRRKALLSAYLLSLCWQVPLTSDLWLPLQHFYITIRSNFCLPTQTEASPSQNRWELLRHSASWSKQLLGFFFLLFLALWCETTIVGLPRTQPVN